jgi:hypothetical protein
MAIRKFSIAEPGVKSNKFWDQEVAQGAMEPIATSIITGNAVTGFDFQNIPQTYQDLRLVLFARNTSTSVTISNCIPQFNADGGTNYSYTVMRGNGTAASSFRSSNQNFTYGGSFGSGNATFGIFGCAVIDILDYKNTSRFKTLLCKSGVDLIGSGDTDISVSTWRSTAAINRIVIGQSYGTAYVSGSTATLYGIKAGA